VAALRTNLRLVQEESSRARVGLASCARNVELLEARLRALENSVSWRFTRPLRTLRRAAKAMRAGVMAPQGDLPIPPDDVRARVVCTHVSEEEFVVGGRMAKNSIDGALGVVGMSLRPGQRVLDWGCGCGRVLRHFAPLFRSVEFHGADVDAIAISWCQAHLTGARFHVSGQLPPLPYPNDHFNLVFGCSVFTHIDLPSQHAWIAELRRILAPGGLLLLSTHGDYSFEQGNPSPELVEARARDGFLFTRNIHDDVLPDWYQTTFQTEAFTRNLFGSYLDVLAYLPRGMTGFQDLSVLRKPA
jgi:SAM-dependent methyltransferase